MRPNYVLIIPLWGRKHAELWLKYSLPSYLADNNFPYLAKNSNFSIVICTDEKTESFFQESAEYEPLLKKYNLSFFNVSHIISKYPPYYYGYILTSCYHEAIQKYGALAHDIHFIFLNADFILADGVFKTVHHLVKKGSEIIFCPSFRVSREGLVPQLDRCITKRESLNVLSVPPRKLVALAFEHIHPTVTAQTINEAPETSTLITNQFYWRAEKNVLLGHHFLIFPFVIKPTHIPLAPTGYIDYNMAYDFHPKGEITYINDSDDAFIVEPEYEHKESEYFTVFPKNNIDYYFKNLSKWINKLHYNNFKQLLVFHTEGLDNKSPRLRAEKIKFADFFGQIDQKLKKRKLFAPFKNHPYFQSTVEKKSFHTLILDFCIRISKKIIESSSQINFRDVYFCATDIVNTGINLRNNLLKLNRFEEGVANYVGDAPIYVDIHAYNDLELTNKLHIFENRKIYVFSFNFILEEFYKKLLSHQKDRVFYEKNTERIKIFLCSIQALQAPEKNRFKRTIRGLKILFMRRYLKFQNPFPYFSVIGLDFTKRKIPLAPKNNKNTPVVLSVPVWGQAHVDKFLSYSLKSQLSPKNIPALQDLHECEYRIHTLPQHIEQITASPMFSFLSKFIPVNVEKIPDPYMKAENKYRTKTFLYQDDLLKAKREGKANGFFNADILFSDGFISESQKILNQFKTIEIVGPRINFENFKEYLLAHETREIYHANTHLQDGVDIQRDYVTLPPRVLSSLAGTFLHDICSIHFLEGKPATAPFHPSHVYWKAGKNGIIAFCFHLYPIFFNGHKDISAGVTSTIDDDLILHSSIRFDERFFATDANLMFACEMSSKLLKENFNVHCKATVADAYSYYRYQNFSHKRLENLRVPHIFGDLDTPQPEWEKALRKATAFYELVEKNVNIRSPSTTRPYKKT